MRSQTRRSRPRERRWSRSSTRAASAGSRSSSSVRRRCDRRGGLRAGLGVAAGRKASYQQTTLQYGAFKGATASTWYQASGPSLFVAGARRAVFVTGALTRQELIAFAEGLKPVPANASR